MLASNHKPFFLLQQLYLLFPFNLVNNCRKSKSAKNVGKRKTSKPKMSQLESVVIPTVSLGESSYHLIPDY